MPSTMPRRLLALAVFALAGAAATGSAITLTRWVEAHSRAEVREGLAAAALPWAAVETDGLQVILTGTAPNEAQRSRAVSVAAGIVDPARVIDNLATAAAGEIPAPRYAVEILRSGRAISLIGLVPAEGRAAVTEPLAGEADSLSDMLETAAHPAPEGWDRALRFGLAAVRALPRSKVSITAGRVAVTGSADSLAQKQELEAQLARQIPAGLKVEMRLSAPRPVLTPFSLHARQEGEATRLEACSASDAAEAGRIRAAAGQPEAGCTLGLGTPSPDWAAAAEAALAALRALGAGEVTLTDADVTLAAGPATTPAEFDAAARRLKTALPAPFVLALVPPEPEVELAAGPAEFDAVLEEGRARLTGRFLDDRQQQTALAYAQARFGAGAVTLEAEPSAAVPEGWGLRVLAGIEALSRLATGQLSVRPELVALTGTSGRPGAQGEIARALAERLGPGASVRIAVRYDKALDPQAALPSPQECVATLNGILEGRKVTFAPGSATIESGAGQTLDAVAQAMRPCIDVRMEIGGHTDSQGRDEMNLQLSQARAEAVLEALLARRVPVGNLSARGYGETQPIADNGREEGREANRRIEFKLILPPGTEGEAAPAEAAAPSAIPAPPPRPGPAGAEEAPAVEMPPLEEEPMDDIGPEEEAGPDDPGPGTEAPDGGAEAAPGGPEAPAAEAPAAPTGDDQPPAGGADQPAAGSAGGDPAGSPAPPSAGPVENGAAENGATDAGAAPPAEN